MPSPGQVVRCAADLIAAISTHVLLASPGETGQKHSIIFVRNGAGTVGVAQAAIAVIAIVVDGEQQRASATSFLLRYRCHRKKGNCRQVLMIVKPQYGKSGDQALCRPVQAQSPKYEGGGGFVHLPNETRTQAHSSGQ